MSDNVMYDSPTEFLHELVSGGGRCDAQSVIPDGQGEYVCACSCGSWEIVATSRAEGLDLARRHTGAEQ